MKSFMLVRASRDARETVILSFVNLIIGEEKKGIMDICACRYFSRPYCNIGIFCVWFDIMTPPQSPLHRFQAPTFFAFVAGRTRTQRKISMKYVKNGHNMSWSF
ncbi:uncharacterized protein LOC133782758 isoform X2 [Humulus lupulus]|uniref:uncharacterized protein LOC133782758 isoform X2 n=1 Tax=Humulus lupulus TaxID=3486 RepID=UPI002B414467|nr:uncharacterized protein LOC133782758 isoform X2 [Humulus lupulus]